MLSPLIINRQCGPADVSGVSGGASAPGFTIPRYCIRICSCIWPRQAIELQRVGPGGGMRPQKSLISKALEKPKKKGNTRRKATRVRLIGDWVQPVPVPGPGPSRLPFCRSASN